MSKEKSKDKYNFLVVLIRTIGIFIRVNPKYFILFLLTNIVAGLIQPFLLIIQQNIFNEALVYKNGQKGISIVIAFVIIYILLKVIIHYIDGLDDILVSYAYIDCETAMTKNLNQKINNLKLDNFEDVELYNKILKAKNSIGITTKTQFHIMSGIIYQVFTLDQLIIVK